MDWKIIGKLSLLLPLLICTACGSALATPVDSPSAPTEANVILASPTPMLNDAPTFTPEPALAAMVNGQPIYLPDYERKLGQYEASLLARGVDPNSPEGQEDLAQARSWILNVMIEQTLTEQAAAEVDITLSDAELDAYMQETVDDAGGEEAFQNTLAEWGETYEEAREEVRVQLIGMKMTQRVIDAVPKTTEHVHARHIQVDTLQEAEHILSQLQAGADFVTLAKSYSQDANTRESGGDLGFFPRGILISPELEEAAFALQPGQISGVVSSTLGYHIVQVIERDPARAVSPESLRLLQDQALQEWIEGLWAEATVQRFIETP